MILDTPTFWNGFQLRDWSVVKECNISRIFCGVLFAQFSINTKTKSGKPC